MKKTCDVCGKPSGQGYNGKYYCGKHHPQRFCQECGRDMGRGLVMGRRLCETCRKQQAGGK